MKSITLDETSKQENGTFLHVPYVYSYFLQLILVFTSSRICKTLRMGKMNIRERAISVGMLMTGLFLRQVVLISTLRFMLFSILFLMISNMYEKLNNIIFFCLNWCVISIGNQLQSECSGRFLAQSEVFVISFKGQCLE